MAHWNRDIKGSLFWHLAGVRGAYKKEVHMGAGQTDSIIFCPRVYCRGVQMCMYTYKVCPMSPKITIMHNKLAHIYSTVEGEVIKSCSYAT